jgi:uncharacterized protein with HEPN domain
MQPESKKYLFDILQAARSIEGFSQGKDLAGYEADPMLRSAIERQFEIVGEALRRLAKEDAATAAEITDHERIISFRNILVHGYAEVDDRIVWDILQGKLPTLLREVESLLDRG